MGNYRPINKFTWTYVLIACLNVEIKSHTFRAPEIWRRTVTFPDSVFGSVPTRCIARLPFLPCTPLSVNYKVSFDIINKYHMVSFKNYKVNEFISPTLEICWITDYINLEGDNTNTYNAKGEILYSCIHHFDSLVCELSTH